MALTVLLSVFATPFFTLINTYIIFLLILRNLCLQKGKELFDENHFLNLVTNLLHGVLNCEDNFIPRKQSVWLLPVRMISTCIIKVNELFSSQNYQHFLFVFSGLVPTLVQIFPHAGLQFGFYSFFKTLWEISFGVKVCWCYCCRLEVFGCSTIKCYFCLFRVNTTCLQLVMWRIFHGCILGFF